MILILMLMHWCRYPDGLAWQFNVPKKVLRRQPEFKKFHAFLVSETEVVRFLFHILFGGGRVLTWVWGDREMSLVRKRLA